MTAILEPGVEAAIDSRQRVAVSAVVHAAARTEEDSEVFDRARRGRELRAVGTGPVGQTLARLYLGGRDDPRLEQPDPVEPQLVLTLGAPA